MAPPCASRMRRQMASPSPTPWVRAEAAASPRTNGSKILATSARDTPGPSSHTQSSIAGPCGASTPRVSMRTRLPSGANFAAFASRFSSTCSSRRASAEARSGSARRSSSMHMPRSSKSGRAASAAARTTGCRDSGRRVTRASPQRHPGAARSPQSAADRRDAPGRPDGPSPDASRAGSLPGSPSARRRARRAACARSRG